MTINDFLAEFLEILQRDEPVSVDTRLADLEEWDSLSVMSTMTWFATRLQVRNPYKTYAEQKTVQDIIDLAGGKIA